MLRPLTLLAMTTAVCTLVPFPLLAPVLLPTNGAGGLVILFSMPDGVPPATGSWMPYAILDPAAVQGVSLSNALPGVTP
ncbi:MAG TPA: hypothetical protein VK824_03225 [Planctomycetota bacterium]|nr:hypothetical protein [Planctomycetota bacterium]